ncbi:MAG: zinc-ribbon domain-containing protein [Myxococcales bacterium]|nr:zinc-ribbon domain-containing protein [Myxococcales bacterium]
MKISCQSCQAKYTIADEKVLGKVVKIRCKKCSATIVINGNESGAGKADDNAETHVFDYTAQGSGEQWTVNVADGDQRSLTLQEIVREYRAGVVTDETYCWKDGMPDWLPLREIEPIQRAVGMGPRPSLDLDEGMGAPAAAQDTGAAAALFGSSNGGGHDAAYGSGGNGLFGGGAEAAAAPAAARRVGGRGGGGADLFGGVAQAGGEEDVMTSANADAQMAARGAAAPADDKLTGQRNENSVLFSLSALTKDDAKKPGAGGGGPENRTTAQADGSGLIDIRALSATMGGSDGPQKSQVDDIMNLSGGGAFGAALAAPILAPPPMEAAPQESSGGGGKGLLFGLIGAGALVAVAIIVGVVIIVVKGGQTVATAPTAGGLSASPIGSLAMADTAATGTSTGGAGVTAPTTTATDQAAPPGTGSATTAAAPATGGTAAKAAATGAAPATTAATTKATTAATTPPATPDPPKTAATSGSLQDALKGAVGDKGNTAPPPANTGGSAPFDRGAAAAALGGVNVASCKKPDGPTGQGHVKVTFGPDGSVQSAVVDGGPFPGTPVGGCIAGKYRGARVPAFAGSPVTVGKSFTIN